MTDGGSFLTQANEQGSLPFLGVYAAKLDRTRLSTLVNKSVPGVRGKQTLISDGLWSEPWMPI
jgi:hypothetical protein